MKENASGPASLSRKSLSLCVCVRLGNIFIRNRLGCGPLLRVKNTQCYLQDVALAMISFCKWMCEGGCQMKDQLWEGPVHDAATPMGAVSASL